MLSALSGVRYLMRTPRSNAGRAFIDITNMDNTKKLLYEMLTTRTGSQMGDSGDIYGRNWEHNIKKSQKDFENDAEVTLDYTAPCTTDDIEISVSLYHYLPQVLELDDLCDAFNALPCVNWECEDVYGVSKRGAQFLTASGFDLQNSDTWNTYNGENNLSQVLQGANLKRDGSVGDYVLIQVHQGCDVRGGYTDAKLFKMRAFQEFLDPTPYITATVTRTNGDTVELETGYHGYKLADGEGDAVDIGEGDTIEASLCV